MTDRNPSISLNYKETYMFFTIQHLRDASLEMQVFAKQGTLLPSTVCPTLMWQNPLDALKKTDI